jgi:hypothetical protein
MNTTELVVTAAGGFWLAVLSFLILLCIRQVTILTQRLDLMAGPPRSEDAGIPVGMPIPEAASRVVDENAAGKIVLLMSATCGPCAEVAAQLTDAGFDRPVALLMPGREKAAERLLGMIPDSFDVIRDPEASELAERLGISMTPYALGVKDGWVVGKSYVNTADDLFRLQDAMDAVNIDDRELIEGGAR